MTAIRAFSRYPRLDRGAQLSVYLNQPRRGRRTLFRSSGLKGKPIEANA